MEPKSRDRFVNQFLVILVRFCVGLIWASAGPMLLLIMGQYGLSRGTVGWYASTAPIAIAVLALPIGIIGAKYSLKTVFAVGAILQAAGILAAFSPNYGLLLVTRILFALGTAFTVPLATTIAAEWFTARELPLVNAITISFVNLGNAVSYVATVPIATVLAWNAPIIVYGAFAFTCALAWMIFGKDRGKTRLLKHPYQEGREGKSEVNIKQILTQRSTIILAIAIMGTWSLTNAMGSWLPSYYHEVFNMPLSKASSITAIVTITGTIASITGGILSIRIGRRKPFLIIPGIFMGLFALGSILFNNSVIIYLSIAGFGFFSSLQNPVIYTIPVELSNKNPKSGAVIFSFMLALGNFGNFLGPLIVGYLTDLTGSYIPGFIILSVLSLTLLVAGIMLPETGPVSRKTSIPELAK